MNTIERDFVLLKVNIENVSLHFRNKRGPIDNLDKRIKCITKDINNENEKEIKTIILNKKTRDECIQINLFEIRYQT